MLLHSACRTIRYCYSTIMQDLIQLCEHKKQSTSWAGLPFHIRHVVRTWRRRTITCLASLKSPCADITTVEWRTLSEASKRELSKRLFLSSRKASWTSCHAGQVHC